MNNTNADSVSGRVCVMDMYTRLSPGSYRSCQSPQVTSEEREKVSKNAEEMMDNKHREYLSLWLNCLVLLFSMAPLYVLAQIPNPDFEQWSGGEPEFWFSTNNTTCYPGAVNITQSSKAHSGNSAVYGKVITANRSVDCGGGTRAYFPGLQTGSFNIVDEVTIYDGFPISGRPKQMRFHVIFKPGNDFVSFNAGVSLTKWDAVNEDKIMVGTGGTTLLNSGFKVDGEFNDSTYTEHIVDIRYYYDIEPDTISIRFSISEVGSDEYSESEFYLDDISVSYIKLMRPSNGDIIISGEKDTLQWDAESGNINISYSLNDGDSYIPIENNYPAESGQYIWDVPKDLVSAKAKIKIEDTEDTTNYDENSVFIKPWQLTRINANGDFELFEPNKHGWSFGNKVENMWPLDWWEQFDYFDGIDPHTQKKYPDQEPFSSAITSDFVDWPIFVDALGIENCYVGESAYSSWASTVWDGIAKNWGGSCEGFAVSSLLYFYYSDFMNFKYPEVGNLHNIYSVAVNNEVRKIVNTYFIHQFANPYLPYDTLRLKTVDARQTLQELKDMFAQNNEDAMPLGFYNNNGSGGHAVTPFKLTRVQNTSVFNLRVYDSNFPGVMNTGIRIDSAANTWTDFNMGWGTGTYGCILGLPSSEHFFNVQLPMKREKKEATAKAAHLFQTEGERLDVYNTSKAEIRIANAGGEIGFKDSLITHTLAGGVPLIPKTGRNHPPIGYKLPLGDYAIQINKFSDPYSYVFLLQESTIYNFRRHDATSSQTDLFTFSNGLGFKNGDATTKNISLETVIGTDDSEFVFVTDNFPISQNDSIHVTEVDRDKLLLQNFGVEKTYDVHIRSANAEEALEFNHQRILLAENTSHLIVPIWESLDTSLLMILVDKEMDGLVNDTLRLGNVVTGTNEVLLTTSTTHQLYQNYPNPFQQSTHIKYTVGSNQKQHVTLQVFDMNGREITRLVDNIQQPGNYEVEFNTNALPGGVYLYKLQVGEFTQMRKMLLFP